VSDHSGGIKRVPPPVAPCPKKDVVQFPSSERVKQASVSSQIIIYKV